MATFNIDCDGVLRNLLVGMCEVYNHEFDVFMRPEDVDKYDVDDVFVLCKEYLNMSAVEFLFDKYGSFCFRHSPMIDKAKEAIDMLHNAGHRICIVTYQKTYENKMDTLYWLNKNNIYYDEICFTKNKNLIKGDYMIDDCVSNLNDITSPTIPICINAPYNKEDVFYPRFDSLYDFVVDYLKDK